MSSDCAECGKTIFQFDATWTDRANRQFHTACGDPLGIKAAAQSARREALEEAAKIIKELPLEYADAGTMHVEVMTLTRAHNAIRSLASSIEAGGGGTTTTAFPNYVTTGDPTAEPLAVAYAALLRLPHGSTRLVLQRAIASIRDALALQCNVSPQYVQDDFEGAVTTPDHLQTSSEAVDGELHFWYFDETYGTRQVVGYIYNDRKHRFDDGEVVRTSEVVEFSGDILRTRNSVYRLAPVSKSMAAVRSGGITGGAVAEQQEAIVPPPPPQDGVTELPSEDDLAQIIYEAYHESGYDRDDHRTFWMAEDGYWPPATKMCVWEVWLELARAILTAIRDGEK